MTDAPTTPTTPSSAAPAAPQPSPTAAAPAAASPPTPQSPATPPATNSVVRPDWAPEQFWNPEKNEIKGTELRAHLDELATFKAAEDSRKLTLPQSAEAYQVTLPEGFTPPVGVDFKFDDKDPVLVAARTEAHAMGLSQDQFSKMLGVYAGAKLNEAVAYETAKTQALSGLGTTGPQRIDAVTRWLAANFDEATVKPVLATMATTQHVQMFEKIISKLTNGGSSSFRQTGREMDTGKVDQATYDKMTYSQKKEYAAKHGQAA